MKLRISIRYKMLLVIAAVLLLAMGTYLYLATSLFTEDKLAYIYDLNSSLVETLSEQTRALFNSQDPIPDKFPHRIAFNVIPHIDVFEDNGYTREELKMVNETRKILHDDSIAVTATTVRVPVFYGHAEAVTIDGRHWDTSMSAIPRWSRVWPAVTSSRPAIFATAVGRKKKV